MKRIKLLAITIIAIVLLTGCNNKEQNNKQEEAKQLEETTIIATSTGVEMDEYPYDETLEIKIENDRIKSVYLTLEFESSENAEIVNVFLNETSKFIRELTPDDYFSVEFIQNGKFINADVNVQDFAYMYGEDMPNKSKAEVIEALKEDGYDIK